MYLCGISGVPWFDLAFCWNIVLYCIIGGGRLDLSGDCGHSTLMEGLFSEGVKIGSLDT